jgi:murein DD-endopeptidase MepM/ murein hydrolase activator NlpD
MGQMVQVGEMVPADSDGRRSNRRRRALLRISLLWASVSVLSASSSATASPCWPPPVTGVVSDGFREPECRWCPGNRGLEYELGTPTVVRAVATGHVTYAGVVAGTRYVVVRLANGWRHTYGRLDSSGARVGQVVTVGSEIGRTQGVLYFGLRVGDRYVDPAPFLGELAGRPRLIPTDGSPPRPAPPSIRRCGASAPSR